jgi:phosphoglycolate phosphatase
MIPYSNNRNLFNNAANLLLQACKDMKKNLLNKRKLLLLPLNNTRMTDLKNRFDSIIFDLDGTLWDSTANVAKAWQKAKEEVDYIKEDITRETVRSITGMAYDAIYDKLFPYLDPATRNDFKARCAKYELEVLNTEGGELYPDLKPTLQYLQAKYKLFVVSNCQCGYIETFLRLNNLDSVFLGHQCYGTKNQLKFQNIIDVVNDFGLSHPVYVGDTQGDYDSATKAGVPIIFATYGFGQVNGQPVATINRFADLQEMM